MIGAELLGLCMIMLLHPEDLLSGWMTLKKMNSKLSGIFVLRVSTTPDRSLWGMPKAEMTCWLQSIIME